MTFAICRLASINYCLYLSKDTYTHEYTLLYTLIGKQSVIIYFQINFHRIGFMYVPANPAIASTALFSGGIGLLKKS